MTNIGLRIRSFRQQKKMSFRELAKRANVSHSFIADIESGRSNPSIDTLKSLSQALDVSVIELIEGTDKISDQEVKKLIQKDNETTNYTKEFFDGLLQKKQGKASIKELVDLKKHIEYVIEDMNDNREGYVWEGEPLSSEDVESIKNMLKIVTNVRIPRKIKDIEDQNKNGDSSPS